MSRLFPHQTKVKHGCYEAWHEGARVVAPIVPTGGGKTVIVGEVINEFDAPTCAIAHRQELVGQISTALAREGVRHSIIAPTATVRSIVAGHMESVGRSFYDPGSRVKVAGVDTLVRMPANDPWFSSVGLVVIDEGHHVLKKNKWGKTFAMFPYARGLLPTATFLRADGAGLGAHAEGIVDKIVEGETLRYLINAGFLTDYRVWCPTSDVDLSTVDRSEATGDFNQTQLREAVHKARKLVGDVVEHYLRLAPGKLGVTFAVDVEEATKIAQAFRDAGVPAEVVSAKTPDDMRRSILRRFRNREILQLVNVDLFGEGFDLPAIEVVSMARPTESYSLYAQQFGRSLRLMVSSILMGAWGTYSDAQRLQFIAESGKPFAMVIDHVGNVERHGLPDVRRDWSRGLNRRDRRSRATDNDAIPLRACPACTMPYERIFKACPHCGFAPEPQSRGGVTFVDGDLTELDPATLAVMRGEIDDFDSAGGPVFGYVGRAIWQTRNARQIAQASLRHVMNVWAGAHPGDTDSMNYRRFYFLFGIDAASAQILNEKDANALEARITARLQLDGFVIPEQAVPSVPLPTGIPA